MTVQPEEQQKETPYFAFLNIINYFLKMEVCFRGNEEKVSRKCIQQNYHQYSQQRSSS
jgi:hypothetical protein